MKALKSAVALVVLSILLAAVGHAEEKAPPAGEKKVEKAEAKVEKTTKKAEKVEKKAEVKRLTDEQRWQLRALVAEREALRQHFQSLRAEIGAQLERKQAEIDVAERAAAAAAGVDVKTTQPNLQTGAWEPRPPRKDTD